MMQFRLACVLMLLLGGWPAMGAASSPLGGYCREGKYTPIETDAGMGGFKCAYPGAVPVVGGQLKAGAVVPVLFIENPRRGAAGNSIGKDSLLDLEFKALEADQRLVGFVGQMDQTLAGELFLGSRAIAIHVEAPKGAAIAYNTLDAIVFENPLPSVERMKEFWVCGITVGVKTPEKPGGNLPWEKTAWGWKTEARWAGPTRGGENPMAMKCVEGWAPEYPKSHRTKIGLLGVVTALAFLGGAMAPKKWRGVGILGLGAALSVGWIVWGSGVERVVEQRAEIWMEGGQVDRWRFIAALRPGEIRVQWDGVMMPMGACEGLTLECDEKGAPIGWKGALSPSRKLGMLSRTLRVEETPKAGGEMPAFSKISRLVSQAYLLEGGWRVKNYVEGEDEGDWGRVFLVGDEE